MINLTLDIFFEEALPKTVLKKIDEVVEQVVSKVEVFIDKESGEVSAAIDSYVFYCVFSQTEVNNENISFSDEELNKASEKAIELARISIKSMVTFSVIMDFLSSPELNKSQFSKIDPKSVNSPLIIEALQSLAEKGVAQ